MRKTLEEDTASHAVYPAEQGRRINDAHSSGEEGGGGWRVVGWSRRRSGADYTPNGWVGAWARVVVDGGVGVGC